MTRKEASKVLMAIENEGFHYAFEGYSDFQEVKDARFHELREKYLAAASELQDYLELQAGA